MQPMIDRIGGEAGVQALVTQFYDLIETLPQGATIMAMHQHGHGMAHVRQHSLNSCAGSLAVGAITSNETAQCRCARFTPMWKFARKMPKTGFG